MALIIPGDLRCSAHRALIIFGALKSSIIFFVKFSRNCLCSAKKSTGDQISKGRTGGIVAKREAGTVRGGVQGGSRGWGEAGVSR